MGNRRKKDRAEQRRVAGALLRRIAGSLARLTAVAVAIFAVGWCAWGVHHFATTSPHLAIETIEIRGQVRASPAEIERLLGIARGENILLAQLDQGEARILQHPWIKRAQVRRSFPQGLEVEVLEREAVALVDLGHLYLVDGGGELFKRAIAGDPLDLPVITGISREAWIERPMEAQERIEDVLSVLDTYAQSSVAERERLSEIHCDPLEGFTLYLGDRGPAVRLGSGELEQKLARLEQVLRFSQRRGERLEWVGLDNRTRPGWIAARRVDEREDFQRKFAGQEKAARRIDEKEQRRKTG